MKPRSPNWGVLLLALAALTRLGWVAWCWHQSGTNFAYPDEELHWQLARNLVEKGTLISDDGRYAARMPLYPLFLSLFAWSAEYGVLLARLAQAMIGVATVWLIHSFARNNFGRKAALLAGALAAFDPFAIFFANLLLTENVFIFIGVSFAVCAWPHLRDPRTASWRTTAGVALFGAAAIMTRPSSAGWVGLLWIFLWLRDRDSRRATLRLGVYAAFLALMLLPWGLRNLRVLGAPAWLSANGGVTLYDAQGPSADGGSNQQFFDELPELAGLGEIERDHVLGDLAWRQMRSDPARVAKLAWIKFRRTWNFIPNVAEYSAGAAALASAAFTAGLLILTVGAVIRTYRRRTSSDYDLRRLHALLFLPVIYFTILHCIFIGSVRYRVPLLPFLEIAAAALLISPSANEKPKPEAEI